MQDEWADATGGGEGTIRLEVQDDQGWQFRLPNTNDTKTLQRLSTTSSNKLHIHRVLKNGVYFSTVQLRQLGSNYSDLKREYDHQSRQVVRDAMQIAATYEMVVERVAELVATLDALCSLAHVAAYSAHGYCKPTLTDSEDDGMGITVRHDTHKTWTLQEPLFVVLLTETCH